jgi:hypothetical protein
MWLGLLWLEGNPWGIAPKFHIRSRLRLHDRSVGIGFIEGRYPGINLVGPESPCFGLIPTTMCIFINDLALFNCSTVGLCSRRLGFPFAARFSMQSNGLMEVWLAHGLDRVMRPVERTGLLQSQPFVYQPVYEKGIDGAEGAGLEIYNTSYVRANSFDFAEGLGALYLQCRGDVMKLEDEETDAWVPDTVLSLAQAYRSGSRWSYSKLDQHYMEQSTKSDKVSFAPLHKRILKGLDEHIGL